MIKYKLQTTPRCLKCRATTKHFKTLESQFINQRFISEWYRCNKCGKVQSKIIKLIGENNGAKISSMV